MKKNKFLTPLNRSWKKLLLTMKLCLMFILVSATALMANSGYSQNTTLTVQLKNGTLRDLIRVIEEQSEFIFVLADEVVDLDKPIDIQIKNQIVDKILDEILKSSELTYRIFDRQIGIGKRNPVTGTIDLPTSLKENMLVEKSLTGLVKDSKGDPIPGTTVIVKGTTIGTITDGDGRFALQVPSDSKILVVSFVGYKTQEIQIGSKTYFNISLEEMTIGLEEVVAVGYGVQKRVSVTGAVSSIVTKDLKQSPSPNLVGALSGRLPGLITIQNSGQPGAEGYNIYLRGVSTTNGQNPLILIDGVPRTNITSVDPNEIASVSILKDASSTAVFGVRGANGVILIATKRGTTQTPQLNVTAEYGRMDLTREPTTVDSWDYAMLRNEARVNDGLLPQYSQESIEKYKSGLYPWAYPNTNWYKVLFKNFAPMSRFNVNASGGTDRVKYFMNAGYTHEGGMLNNEPKSKLGYDAEYKLDRFNFRTNLDIDVNRWIKGSVNLAGYIEKVNAAGGPSGGITSSDRGNPFWIVVGLYLMEPTMPGPVTVDGYDVPVDEVISTTANVNPTWGMLNRSGYYYTERSNLNSSVALDFDLKSIAKGLTSKLMVSFDSRTTSITNGNKSFMRYYWSLSQQTDPVTGELKDNITFTPSENYKLFPITLTKATAFDYTINLQWAINYARTFGNRHQVTGMVLAQRDNVEAASGSSDLLLPYNILGVSGRVTYDLSKRYLLEFNAGYNGSEQFQKGHRFGFFPAVSVGWVVSNERFMKAQDVISNLKLRASYGKVGNDKLGNDRFLYLDNVSATNGGFSSSLGLGKYVNEDLVGNPLITWETAYKQNYGVEVTLLKDLSFTGDLFYENRKGILITRGTVPAMQGLPLSVVPKANMGEVSNKGYELELVYNKTINKDLSFIIRGNYNYNRNTVKNMDEPPYDETYAFRYRSTGYSLSQNWGYMVDWKSIGKGYWTSQEEIDNSGLIYNGIQPKPGDFVYKDINGDKIIDIKDQVPIKYGFVPRVTYGLNFSLTYKGFDLSALIQGVAKTSQYYSSWGVMENTGGGRFYDYHRSAWTKERYESGEKITYPRLTTINSSSLAQNDFFIMDRSYIRLKNAEIGYTLPSGLSKRIGTQRIRVYTNGQNIFVWDKLLTKNFDPEQRNSTAVPIQRIFNVGANIVF